jgi:TPR repeat protein
MPVPFGARPRSFIAALALALSFSLPAWAAPVDVEFLPPDIPAQDICVEKRADPEVVARWTGWDGQKLPLDDPDLILRDARRLRDLNAGLHFELIEKMFAAVAAMPGLKKVPDTAIDRINLYIKAGKTAQLREIGLIDELEAKEASLAPKALNLLSGLYLDGIVVAKDPERGQKYLVAAAMGGNADALLRLARLNLSGQQVPNWDLDPQLAVTMAFGALVGKLDPEICDRIGRIAREYASGEVVAENHDISVQWYRLAADLGDGGAAWKVAGYHLTSELIEKDNDTLLKYLTLAADDGIAGAQVELGKLYEAGALLPQDLEKADFYFSAAAEVGNRAAFIRLATLLEPKAADPAGKQRYIEVLNRLGEYPQPPGWVYSKLAEMVLEDKGRWAGEAEAAALLEKGVALEDADSAAQLASILLRKRDDPGQFERATELLAFSVSNAGKIDPMTDLRNAYLCRAPEGSDLRLADFWQYTEDAAGSATEFLKPAQITALATDPDPLALARLQTHALYGRPNSVAYYLDYLQQNGADPEVIAFWQKRIDPVPATIDAVARHQLEGSVTPEVLEKTIAMLEQAREAGLPRAPLDLAAVLLDYFPGDVAKTGEALEYLQEAARAGTGEAIMRLLPIANEAGISKGDLYSDYAAVIEERGDADALIFAASVTADPTKREDYLDRAASVMDCGFENTINLAQTYAATGDTRATEHWLDVSLKLAGDDGWRQTAIADQFMTLAGENHVQTALGLYEKGVALGDQTAVSRLLKIYGDPNTPAYAPDRAVAMFEKLIGTAQVGDLAAIREKVLKAPTVIQTTLMQKVDWAGLYRKPAEAGNPEAMREFALYLQENGTTVEDARAATGWLRQASEAGDAEAMVALAKAYAMGLGLEPSINEATALLETAAGKGSTEAQRLLATMGTTRQN